MVQSSFIERAKQGDPTAIEYLMNLTLQPRGVTAKTYLNDRCLYVVFSADRLLNRTTLINFLQHGFSALETGAIERVKVYAQKIGETLPAWSEEISLQSSAPKCLEQSYPSLHPKTTTFLGPIWSEAASRISQTSQGLWQQSRQVLAEIPLRAEQLLHNPTVSKRLALAGLAIFGTMLLSRVVATHSNRQTPTTASPSVPVPEWTVASPNPEAEAKQYLERMNQAQQSFYLKNGRFASTLEELERSAGMLTQSDSYTYQLSFPTTNQSVLTAIPKVERLKSYVAIVSLNPSETANPIANQICASDDPAIAPPTPPAWVDSTLQCATGSVSVLQ